MAHSTLHWLNDINDLVYSSTFDYDKSVVILNGKHIEDKFYFNKEAYQTPAYRAVAYAVWPHFDVILSLDKSGTKLQLVALKGKDVWNAIEKERNSPKPETDNKSKQALVPGDGAYSPESTKKETDIKDNVIDPNASGYSALTRVINRMLDTAPVPDGPKSPRICLIIHNNIFAEVDKQGAVDIQNIDRTLETAMKEEELVNRGHAILVLRERDPVERDAQGNIIDQRDVFSIYLQGKKLLPPRTTAIEIFHSLPEVSAFLAREYIMGNRKIDMGHLKEIEDFTYKFCSREQLIEFSKFWKKNSSLFESWSYASSRAECKVCHRIPSSKAEGNDCDECKARMKIQEVLAWGGRIYSDWNLAKLAGMEEAKRKAQAAILELLRNPPNITFVNKRYILLFGPPGTGKTTFALALSGEYQLPLNTLSASEMTETLTLVDGRMQAISNFFKVARSSQRSIILLDEVESVSAKTEGKFDKEDQKGVNTLKEEMAGANSINNNFYIVACTNTPQNINTAILRRFSGGQFYVGLPSPDERIKILRNELGDSGRLITDQDIVGIVNRLSCATGSDISDIVNKAKESGESAVSKESLLEAIDAQPMAVKLEDLYEMHDWCKKNSLPRTEIQKLEADIGTLEKFFGN